MHSRSPYAAGAPVIPSGVPPVVEVSALRMPEIPAVSPAAFLFFKLALYGVFIHNAVVFGLTHDTPTAAIEGFAWIALIGVVEWELTREENPDTPMAERVCVHSVNVVCHGVIVYTTIQFALEGEWRDVINSGAWLGVSAVLYWEAFVPGADTTLAQRILNTCKVILYSVLVIVAVVWSFDPAARLEALDAWLWLVAFAVIEMDVLGLGEGAEA